MIIFKVINLRAIPNAILDLKNDIVDYLNYDAIDATHNFIASMRKEDANFIEAKIQDFTDFCFQGSDGMAEAYAEMNELLPTTVDFNKIAVIGAESLQGHVGISQYWNAYWSTKRVAVHPSQLTERLTNVEYLECVFVWLKNSRSLDINILGGEILDLIIAQIIRNGYTLDEVMSAIQLFFK